MIELKNGADLELAIATAKNRFSKNWKNTTKTWSELVNRLSTTHRTHETVADYRKMGKDEQSNIKDIGGFVGGELRDGQRRNGHVLSRSMVTLDADFAPVDFWEDVETFTTYAVVAYSTHKHTPDKPRLRLIIPLSRKVTPEEYEAIARKLAADIGIDYFDDTTYEPTRLMYWPSTSKDGTFFFRYVDAPILDPDTILSSYTDWRDASFWPESSRCSTIRKKTADKQGDPLAKSGLIGAFCRAYTIQDAIAKFLPDVYLPCRTEGRYTYAKGSTAAGLVVYEDKFAYSNHGTDPISGQLCNAFDLVRIHLFGELDADAGDVATSKLPSWAKMMELAGKDEETRYQIGADKLEAAAEDFGEDLKDPENKEWLKKLTTTKTGAYEATIANLKLIIKNDPNLRGIGGRDLFRNRYNVTQKLPWQRTGQTWTDLDDAGLRDYIEQVYEIESRQKIIDALTLVFEENSYNPVKDYIEAAAWDGKPRVETLLIDYLGAADTLYTRTVTRKALVAAIARVYNPGCKFDYMLTLVGKQGIGKSLIIKRLAGEWFSDTLTDIRGKESYEALDGVWIMEMGELAALKRGEREAIKGYISKTEDTYRKAYARNTTISKRQCIFIGTTNDEEFLDDPTGNRRFWVVDTDFDRRTKTVWEDLTQDEVHQVWAEALEIYRNGDENVMALNADVKDAATEQQKAHSSVDALRGIIEDMLATPIPEDWDSRSIYERQQFYNATNDYNAEAEGPRTGKLRQRVCAIEIWVEALGKDPAALNNPAAKRINDCLEQLGWTRGTNPVEFKGYGRQRGFYRPKEEDDL